MNHESLLSLSQDELYERLYAGTMDHDLGFSSGGNPLEVGKKIFSNIKNKLYNEICVKNTICSQIDVFSESDEAQLLQIIGDIIASSSIGFPPFTLAALIVKIGVHKFCDC